MECGDEILRVFKPERQDSSSGSVGSSESDGLSEEITGRHRQNPLVGPVAGHLTWLAAENFTANVKKSRSLQQKAAEFWLWTPVVCLWYMLC